MNEKFSLSIEQQKINREKLFTQLPESVLFWPSISKEDRAKLEEFRNFLKENPLQNVIIFFNHTSYLDPLFAGYVANLIDPEMTKELIIPMSYRHTEDDTWVKRLINLPSLIAKQKAEEGGIQISRVIQTYQINDSKYGYTKEQAYKVNKEFPRLVKQNLKDGKSMIIIISPEGHRSKGALIEAESGIAMIGQITDAFYIPLGIDYEGIYTRGGIHIGETRIKIGKISRHNPDINFDQQTSEKMIDLANVLPQKRRGFYAKSV